MPIFVKQNKKWIMIQHKKYIIKNGKPIMFDSDLLHADIIFENTRIDSAGFVTIWEYEGSIKVFCSGESTSLSISCRPEIDELLIIQYLGLNCD